MLPPGIFLWESGQEDLVFPTTLSHMEGIHPLWQKDMQSFGPWEVDETTDLPGRVLKGGFATPMTIVVVGSCTTTMEVARKLAASGTLGPWGAVVSVEQSSGRGQLRRPWVSSVGNLHVSFVMPSAPEEGAWADHLADLLPIVLGSVFGEVLEGVGVSVKIKWPNDLLQENRKVAGMLVEECDGIVILGMGVNLAESPPDEMMREDCSVSAGKLQISNGFSAPLSLLELLVNRGRTVYANVLDELQPTQFISAAARRLAWLGRTILVREGGKSPYEAEIIGLSPKGGLVLRCSGKETVLYSGSVFPL